MIAKRFFPSKEVGHAAKVLAAAHKAKVNPTIPHVRAIRSNIIKNHIHYWDKTDHDTSNPPVDYQQSKQQLYPFRDHLRRVPPTIIERYAERNFLHHHTSKNTIPKPIVEALILSPDLSKAPIPPKMPAKPVNQGKTSEPITPAVLQNAKNTLKPVPKPKVLDPIQVHQYNNNGSDLFKSIGNNKSYYPTISGDTDIHNLKKQEVLDFCSERGLCKKDEDHNSQVNITIKPHGTYKLGIKENMHKLTKHGQAYHSKIMIYKNGTITEEFVSSYIMNVKAQIIIAKHTQIESIIPTGNTTHLLHGYLIGDYYYVSGYYTSKKTGDNISKTQYADYQAYCENNDKNKIIPLSEKPQKFIMKQQLQKIAKNDVFIPKWSEEYLFFVQQHNYFQNILKTLKDKPFAKLNNTGVTQEEAGYMCQHYDYNCAKKQKHPKTYDDYDSEKTLPKKQIKEHQDDQEIS